ncbi:MAG: type VI secretion system baseplate subunit TssF, partial [Pirellulales bacterium]|nr:type VI secretion system baseplate subunit TssF [Pirellulales bacterium]
MESQFLDHYNRELGYLRELGNEFAREYPAVAGRLGMDEFSCADPYVERLLEGFAFLAARVYQRLDAEFPRFTGGLLESIYPHYTRPIPSAAVVAIQPDPDEGSLAAGYHLPRGSRLQGPSTSQFPTPCRFETTQDLDLWPLRIDRVELLSRDSTQQRPLPALMSVPGVRSCLRITLNTTAGLPMSALSIDRLSVHLRGGEIAHQLHELLFAHTHSICVGDSDQDHWQSLPAGSLIAGGFEAEESLLPEEPRSFSGYRLLQEYFLLPEKFLFANLSGLRPAVANAAGKQLEIVIGFDAVDRDLPGRLNREHLALHCVPVVNLFRQRADRVPISDTRHEHHLLVDRSRPMDFEIWSVEQLLGHGKT